MPRMVDLIRSSQVPSNLMQSAARGSLSVPPAEMLEILVHLALHNKVFSEKARMTLAGWDEKASLAAAADPATPPEVLGYLIALENLRPKLLPALIENLSVTEEALCEVAARGARPAVGVLLSSRRVMRSTLLLRALETNANLRPNELGAVKSRLAALEGKSGSSPSDAGANGESATAEGAAPADGSGAKEPADPVAEEALATFLKENAAEIDAEPEKPFQPIGMIHDEADVVAAVQTESKTVAAATEAKADADPAKAATEKKEEGESAADGKYSPGTAAAAARARKKAQGGKDERESTLQKIARLDVKGRIALAVRGNKEERSILIRDGTKLVAIAVLDSPKVSDGEVEGFALQKNVLEAVLRQIPLKRRFAKNYNVVRNLVYNPRTPLDLSLGLIKNLMTHDLKNLSGNKEVSETIRKVALRMYKTKAEKKS